MEETIMGTKIIAASRARGLSRSRLSAELGVTTRTLASRFKGQSEWRLRELVILSVLLDIPLLELVADVTSLLIDANPDGVIATRIPDIRWGSICENQYIDTDDLYV